MEMCIQQIPLGEVDIPDGQRALGHIEELMASIQEVGLLQAIRVIPRGTRYRVIFGGRRAMAYKRLGWSEIPAVVLEMDDLHAELATIDENLVRQELTILERSEQLSRKKEIYEALHAETKRGNGPGRGRREKKRNKFASFADDTASKTGCTPRTVQQEVQIARNLSDRTKEIIRPLPIADKKTDHLRLMRLPQESQEAIAELLGAGAAKSVLKALRALNAGRWPWMRRPTRSRVLRDRHRTHARPEWSLIEKIRTPSCTLSSNSSNSHPPSLKGRSLDGRRRRS
jgi:ParB family transcriptional regulator, chromosome partitioning protein